MQLPQNQGFTSQLKEGYSSNESKIGLLANRCFSLAESVSRSFGPLGSKIMLINRLGRIHVTGDSQQFFDQIEINGPDSKLVIDALKMQYEECGDGCKLFLLFTSALVREVDNLLREGISRYEVLEVYNSVCQKVPAFCEEITVKKLDNLLSKEQLVPLINNVVSPKVVNDSLFLSGLVYDACLKAMYPYEDKSKPLDFGVESVKVCQIAGGSIRNSYFVPGLVLDGKPDGQVYKREQCKVAIFTCGFDFNHTEGTATVLFKSAAELGSFSRDEERAIEQLVKGLSDAGVGVVISSGKSNDLLLHFANKYNIMVMNVSSKLMLRRLSVCLDAKLNVTMKVPSQEMLGFVDCCEYRETQEQDFVTLQRKDSIVSTIVLFGTTEQLRSMAESGILSGVNFLKVLTRNPGLVAGAGAFELALGKLVREYGKANFAGDIKSYIYDSIALALESIPKTLIENSGITEPGEAIAEMFEKHRTGLKNAGAVVQHEEGSVRVVDDVTKHDVLDALYPKLWAMTYAFGAVEQLVRVNTIIMARSADFKLKSKTNWDDDGKI